MTGRRRRTLGDEEHALFEETLKDVVPLKKTARRRMKPAAPKRAQNDIAVVPPPVPVARVSKPPGLDGNTADRLRRGQLSPEARLDLHGLTEAAAHRALVAFLLGARARRLRLVLVVTGKGARAARDDVPFDLELDMRGRGILRTMTPRWLAEPELASFVVDVREAHVRHGGGGALYVYLRKN